LPAILEEITVMRIQWAAPAPDPGLDLRNRVKADVARWRAPIVRNGICAP
jgi:hypothetical protein